MNVRILFMLLLGLIIIIGCTACDPNSNATIDLTRSTEVLTNPMGWVAQEKYEVVDFNGDKCILKRLVFTQNSDKSISVSLDGEDGMLDSDCFSFPKEGDVIFECTFTNCEYILKVSATADSEPILTLTEKQTFNKMYFSLAKI
jgi:hypothetical protein